MASQFCFGAGNEKIEVHLLGFTHSPSAADTGRLDSTVHVAVGAFSGSFKGEFSTQGLMSLRRELSALLSSGSGTAAFKSVGDDVSLVIQLFESGNVTISGAVRPRRLPQATLDFRFDLPEEALFGTH